MFACTSLSTRNTNAVSYRADGFGRELSELRPELRVHAFRLTRSQAAAEDLVQDTVERALRFRSTFQAGTNLRAWAHQILFSVFITGCRRQRRERSAMGILATDPCAWTAPEGRPEAATLSPRMARALESVPLAFRAVMVLVDLEGMAYKDAAVLLGVPVGTVMSRLFRGRSMLAEQLRGANDLPMAA